MADINDLLHSCTSDDLSERVSAYHSLTEKLTKLSPETEWGHEIHAGSAKQIMSKMKEDLFNEEKNINFEVTGFFGCYLANERLMDLLTQEEEQEIFDSLIKCFEETENKSVLIRGLWSLAQSKFECETYNKNLAKILGFIYDILKCDPTNFIIFETLQVMKSLIESVPKEILEKVDEWFPKLFVYLFHDTSRVRSVAYSCLNFCQLYSQQQIGLFHEQIIPFIPALKSEYCKKMKQFIDENCPVVFKIWRLLVIILGKDLHSGTQLINGLLEVVEKAFKSPRPEFRVDAFKCWHGLISNFSTESDVLTHPKRIKLLAAPLKSNNAKTEEISHTKLHTWWFLLCKMGDNLSSNFDSLIIPLLKFCFNHNRVSQCGVSERTLVMSRPPPPCTKYPNLVLTVCEVLIRVLSQGDDKRLSHPNFVLNQLPSVVISGSLLMKHSTLILGCVADALLSLDSVIEKHFSAGILILESLMKLVNGVLTENVNKKESVEFVSEVFTWYDFMVSESKNNDSIRPFTYQFLKMTIIGDLALPHYVLHSNQYYLKGSNLRDMMNGTLSNYFIHNLCQPAILQRAFTDTSDFVALWRAVMEQSNPASKLFFLETVMEELRHVIPSFEVKDAEILISLWIAATQVLHHHIEETQQINQGNNSEHDWSCIYNTLLFPLSSLNTIYGINPTVYEDMMAAWSSLWHWFSSLTPLTATAEPNCEADFIAQKLISLAHERFSLPGGNVSDKTGFAVAFFADVIFVVIEKLRFKEVGRKAKKVFQSPFKPKKKPHPLHNLSSIVELLNLLMEKTLQLVSKWRQRAMLKLTLSFTKLFINLTNDRIVWPAVSSFVNVLKKSMQINPSAKFEVEVEHKFMGMWNAFCGLVECRIVPRLTQEQLTTLSPLLCIALQSSNLGLKQRTRHMWSTSFASTSLNIPNDLFDVLKTVELPPASISEVTSSETQSLSPKENIPAHISGSFLNRERNHEISPFSSVKLNLKDAKSFSIPAAISPLSSFSKKSPKSPKFNLHDMKFEEFVAVSSPKVKKRVLTPHQIEKMRERRSDIPALYNDLSQSASQFLTQESQDVSVVKLTPQDGTEKRLTFKGHLDKTDTSTISDVCQSPAGNDLKNRSYSDEDLDEVLRDVSVEMQRSFSDSVVILDTNIDTKSLKKSSEELKSSSTSYSNEKGSRGSSVQVPKKTDNHSAKRKSSTPSRKCLADIKKSLKGISSKRPKLAQSPCRIGLAKEKCSKETSPLATPIKSPVKISSSSNTKLASTECEKNVVEEEGDDDEVPNSQMEISKESTLLLYPKGRLNGSPSLSVAVTCDSSSNERPKRKKRKSIFEDDTIYVTPTKRSREAVPGRSSSKSKDTVVTAGKGEVESSVDGGNQTSVTKVGRMPDTKDYQIGEEENPLASCRESADGENNLCSEKAKALLTTPTKVNRLGRRIIAPNRDMPEPMTPPGATFKRRSSTEEAADTKTPDLSFEKTNRSSDSSSKKRSITTRSQKLKSTNSTSAKKMKNTKVLENMKKQRSLQPDFAPQENKSNLNTPSNGKRNSASDLVQVKDTSNRKLTFITVEDKRTAKDKCENGLSNQKESPSVRLKRLSNKLTPVMKTRHSKRISSQRKLTTKTEHSPPPKEIVAEKTRNVDISAKSGLREQKEFSKGLENSSTQSHSAPCEKVDDDASVIEVEEEEEEKIPKITFKDDFQNSSFILKAVDTTSLVPSTSSASSSIPSTVIVSSSSVSKMEDGGTAASNASKYKVVFSSELIRSPNEQKTRSKPCCFSGEIHIPNGGIVFTNSKIERNLLSKCLQSSGSKHSLQKTKSLDRFSPVKPKQASPCKPTFQVNFKKFGKISNNAEKSRPSTDFQPSFRFLSNESITKVSVRDLDISHSPRSDNKNRDSSAKEIHKEKEAALSQRIPSPSKQLSPMQRSPPYSGMIRLKDHIFTSPTNKESNVTPTTTTTTTTTSQFQPKGPLKIECSPKFKLIVNKSSPLLESLNSPPHNLQLIENASTSPNKYPLGSPRALNQTSPSQELKKLSPSTLKDKKIFLISPKGSNNSFPVQKLIYSNTLGSPVALNSPSSDDKKFMNNKVLVFSSDPGKAGDEAKNKTANEMKMTTSNFLVENDVELTKEKARQNDNHDSPYNELKHKVTYETRNVTQSKGKGKDNEDERHILQSKNGNKNEEDNDKNAIGIKEAFGMTEIDKEKDNPVMIEIVKEKDTPVTTEIEKDTPVTTEIEKDTPVTTEIEKDTPVTSEIEKEKDIPVITGIEKDTPVTTEIEKDTPVITEIEKEKDASVMTEIEKEKDTPVTTEIEKQNNAPVTTEIEKEEDSPIMTEIEKEYTDILLSEGNQKRQKKTKIFRKAASRLSRKNKTPLKNKVCTKAHKSEAIACSADDVGSKENGPEDHEVSVDVAITAGEISNGKCPVDKDLDNKAESRLTSTVSTPERKKLSVRRVQVPGSRAAIMVACAKRTMRTRVDETGDGVSAISSSEGGSCSPSVTPINKKRSFADDQSNGSKKPWAKHEPSPGASPCGSILKKRQAEEDVFSVAARGEITEFGESSPSSAKCRKVSFADPPVSESVEIPPSPKLQKSHKAQKRLDMTQALKTDAELCLLDDDPQKLQETFEISLKTPNCSQPLYSSLLSCSQSVDDLASSLTSPLLCESLKVVFRERGLKTVGEFCAQSEMDVESLPIYPPKISKAIQCLKNFEQKLNEKSDAGHCGNKNSSGQTTTDECEPSKESKTPSDIKKNELVCVASEDEPIKTTEISLNFGTDNENCENDEQRNAAKSDASERQTLSEVNPVTEKVINPKNSSSIKESEFPWAFSHQMQDNSAALSSFVDGLSSETKLKLFESLVKIIPYRNVIDMFHQYLITKQNLS